MVVVLITGETCAGKGTFCSKLEEIFPGKVARLKFSDILGDALEARRMSRCWENYQKIHAMLRKEHGDDVLTLEMEKRIKEAEVSYVLIDGGRARSDYEMVRKFENNFVVHLTADILIRYNRFLARSEKLGDEKITFQQFVELENAPGQLRIRQIELLADLVINTNFSTSFADGLFRSIMAIQNRHLI